MHVRQRPYPTCAGNIRESEDCEKNASLISREGGGASGSGTPRALSGSATRSGCGPNLDRRLVADDADVGLSSGGASRSVDLGPVKKKEEGIMNIGRGVTG